MNLDDIIYAIKTASHEDLEAIKRKIEEDPDAFFSNFPYPEIAKEEFELAKNERDLSDDGVENAHALIKGANLIKKYMNEYHIADESLKKINALSNNILSYLRKSNPGVKITAEIDTQCPSKHAYINIMFDGIGITLGRSASVKTMIEYAVSISSDAAITVSVSDESHGCLSIILYNVVKWERK